MVDAITRKLIRRHPMCFLPATCMPRWTLRVWTRRRSRRAGKRSRPERAEKSEPEQLSLLDDVPAALPALSRAAKLQKRAATVGFDWPDALPVLDKVREELDEVLQAMADGEADALEDEIGDLLFAAVNLARHLKQDPENALRRANRKFERRFRFIEQALRDNGRPIEDCTLDELDALWGEAKSQERTCPAAAELLHK